MAAFEVYANASDRDDVEIPDFLLDDYEDVDTYDEIKGVDLYPEWLELLKQARAADELLKNTTREVAATPSKSMYLVVVDNLLEYGYHPCQTMEEVEQVKQNYMSSETEVYRCELVESNGLFLG